MSQQFEKSSLNLSKKKIIFNNFIGGISWALGATVGLSIVLAILGFFAKNIDFVPIIGKFVANIISFIHSANPNFK